jgi:ribA/ribD-fused uncharacterized protein
MSSSVPSVEQFQALQASIDAMRADIAGLSSRLEAALQSNAAPTATATSAGEKKRGRKPKATAEPTENVMVTEAATPVKEKKERKKREPKEKATCPPAAEGVIRFAGSGVADKNEYKVFNNMYRSPFNVDDKEFPSVAHYLAYKKYETTDKEYADKMLAQKNPALLTGMLKSKDHVAHADWDTVQNELLQTALQAKFKNAELRQTLLKTDGKRIEFESATDSYFGIGADGNGANTLGKALATLRVSLA